MDLQKELYDRGFSRVIVFETYIDAVYGNIWFRYWRDKEAFYIANHTNVNNAVAIPKKTLNTFINMVECYLKLRKGK